MFLRFLARTTGVLVLVVGMLTAAFAGSASACSCYPNDSEAQRYARAGYVFTGVVLAEVLDTGKSSDTYDDNHLYVIRVGTEYKGDVPVAVVTVETTVHGSMCGTRLAVGQDYLVFAYGSQGIFRTNSCSGNRAASGGPPITGPTTTPTATAAGAGAATPCAAQAV
ncbi:hypothetical protein Q5530_02025 [Saccharothrix sp. BKS2]|uniref:hypothetical protein n=1 Tax=Saccharothrix sp. BKS2 TaxID=3064400 RepID=UPI0039E789BA